MAQWQYRSIKTGFANLCGHPDFKEAVSKAVRQATQVALEGSLLANLYMQWELENALNWHDVAAFNPGPHDPQNPHAPPPLDNQFFRHCFGLVGKTHHETAVAQQEQGAIFRTPPRVFESLIENNFERRQYLITMQYVRDQQYVPARRALLNGGVEAEYGWTKGINAICNQLAQDYAVTAKNHVTTNFEGRLKKYMALRVTRALAEPGKLDRQLVAGVNVLGVLAWLQPEPVGVGVVGANWTLALVGWLKTMPKGARWALANWITDSLVLYTTRAERDQLPGLEALLTQTGRSGVPALRRFLEDAPLETGGEGVVSHSVQIVCERIYREQYERYQDVADLWLRKDDNWHRFFPWLYEIQMAFERCNGSEMSGRIFTVLPVCSNKAKYIQLDNGTLRLLVRYYNNTNAMPLQTIAAPEDAPQWASYIRLKQVMTNVRVTGGEYVYLRTDGVSASVVCRVRRPVPLIGPKLFEGWALHAENPQSRVVALDPGKRFLFWGAYKTGGVDGVEGEKPGVRMSVKEFRDVAKFERTRKKQVEWLRNDLVMRQASEPDRLPWGASTVDGLKARIAQELEDVGYKLDFMCANRCKRVRWKNYIGGQKALMVAARRITDGDRQTVVALGDAKFSSYLKGHATGAQKGLQKLLKREARAVVEVTEWGTSKVCSVCKRRRLKGAIYGTGPYAGRESHWVRVCQFTLCRTRWHRDRNASRNILDVYCHMVTHGGQVPVYLRPP